MQQIQIDRRHAEPLPTVPRRRIEVLRASVGDPRATWTLEPTLRHHADRSALDRHRDQALVVADLAVVVRIGIRGVEHVDARIEGSRQHGQRPRLVASRVG
ncbi:MAG: hypothetical protein JWO36_7138 [Myxococcales bacterium]|nr:hypothetical protein [Myxococcales bacterium]